jgi:hypothetical protein
VVHVGNGGLKLAAGTGRCCTIQEKLDTESLEQAPVHSNRRKY